MKWAMSINMNVSNGINKVLFAKTVDEILLIIGIMLIPYDALRVMPSEYRPVAIFPLLFALLFCFARRNNRLFTKCRVLLLIFTSYAILTTSLISSNTDLSIDRVPSFMLTLGIGLFMFFAFGILFLNEIKTKGVSVFLDWLFTWLSRAYVIPVFVGIIEMLSLIGLLPYSFGAALSHFLVQTSKGG